MKKTNPRPARRKPDKVTIGNVTVKIYRRDRPTITGGTRTIYEVADYTGGTRRMHGFSDAGDAKREAERIAGLLSSGESTAANFRNADAAEYGNAIAILRNANLETSLQTVADRYVQAVKILGTENIIDAAKCYVLRNPANREHRTMQQVADELVTLKENRKASARYIQDLRARLNTMAEKFSVNVDTVTTREVMGLLTQLNLERHITVLLVTHEDDVAAYAKRVVRVKDGLIESDVARP